eukprot:TRINITY_DN7601_c0_g1_i1.p1 TRINITY_DN7601_c0_g1~~TRINITY_DN7601_c0_g1_i1.p1  ORF type:complete len:536 (+),score=159.12 TRINITY_DN7601_c0_g1_i1:145-1752(+)
MSDSPTVGAKRAPATGMNKRVVRPGANSMIRHPLAQGSSGGTIVAGGSGSGGTLTGEDKKRRPFTTPARIVEQNNKRDPSTPTRTIRPYRPNTGGLDRLMSPPEKTSAPGVLAVLDDEPMVPIGVMAPDEYMAEDVDEEQGEVDWVEEDVPHGAAPSPKPTSRPAHPLSQSSQQPSHAPHPTSPPKSAGLAQPPINFGKDGSKVRTGSKTLIGKGSFGCVFKGLHEGTNQIVAIKEVHLTGESANKVNSIKKEIQLMKRLNHPNIVRYLGAERVKTQLHIYLEFVTGGSMASLVREYGPLTDVMTRKYSRQILEGLHYLHLNNIVHRDIKGDNLLVGTDGTVKLADFGTSKELRTLAATVTGTACFMAPEVIKGTGHGLASDVWSLGCAVIEMLRGKPPFSDFENQYTTMMYVAGLRDAEKEIPENVNEQAKDFLRRCLKVDPDARDTTTQLLQVDWFANHPEDVVPAAGAGATPLPNGDPFLGSEAVGPGGAPGAFPHPEEGEVICSDSEGSADGHDGDGGMDSYNPMLSYVES